MPGRLRRSPFTRRLRHWYVRWLRFSDPVLGSLRRRWSSSLAVRLMSTVAVVTFALIAVAGGFIMTSVRDDLTDSRLNEALLDSARATVAAQQSINSAEANERVTPTAIMGGVRAAIQDTSASRLFLVNRQDGQPYVPDAPQNFATNLDLNKAITSDLTAELRDSGSAQLWQYALIEEDNGEEHPGVIVATTLEMPQGAGVYNLYIGYSFAETESSLHSILRTLLLTALVLLILILAIVWIISRIVFEPVRSAALTSERLAGGDREARMPYQNDKYFDVLSDSFNNMADTLSSRIEELDRLSVMQQRFVSDVSHELRTPLTTIRLASEVLTAGAELPPAQNKAANVLQVQVERFDKLLADLLEISRYDAGRVQIETEPTQLVSLCQAVVDDLQPLSASLIDFRAVGGYDQIDVDPRRIRRIVSNLVGNAIEHGEGEPIVVTLDSNDTAYAITVRDYGIGMNVEQTQHVFDRFWRGDPSRKRTLGGTGLGLAISQEDAAVHGGALEVWSAPGIGTNFRLTLPRNETHDDYLSPLPLVPDDVTDTGHTESTGGWLSRPRRWLSRGGK